MKNCYKRLISLLFVAVFCVSLSVSAFAEPAWLTRAKAGIAAFMFASNLVIEPVNAQMSNVLAEAIDPFGIVQTIGDTAWSSYLDQSVIQIRDNVVTIDGVQYSDILLGPEAAQALRLAGLDFASAYNLVNNQDVPITYAEGVGDYDGTPLFNINGTIRSQIYSFPVPSSGSAANPYTYELNNGLYKTFKFNDVTTSFGYQTSTGSLTYANVNPSGLSKIDTYFEHNSRNDWFKAIGSAGTSGITLNSNLYHYAPFSFDYTSGIIDAPLESDDWLQIRVPTSFTDPDTGTGYDINDVLTDYPQLTDGKDINIDPQLNPDFQTDIDIGDTIGDLINTILNLLDLLPDGVDFNITKNVEPQPEPEPAPVPDPEDIPDVRPEPVDPEIPGTIAETNWNFLSNLLRWIQSTIDNFRVATSNALYNIDKILNEIHDILVELPEYLRRFFDPDWWNKWLDAKEKHAIDTIKKGIEALKRILLPIFLSLKNAIGIWHYVVEWLSAIGTPFAWIIARFSSMGGNSMLPIYASIAGLIVIAVYKRFGR